MIANRNFEQCEPLTWLGRVPVYLSTALAAAHGIAMVFTALAMAADAKWFFQAFEFSPQSAVGGMHVWQFATYAFVNKPDIFIAVQLVLFAVFGRDVEQFIGRRSFALLYAALVLAAPVLLSVLGLFDVSTVYFGSGAIHFAIFIAFVLIYPRAEMFGIQARWIAIGLLGIATLQMVAYRQWIDLLIQWWECLVAALWLMRERGTTFSLPALPRLPSVRRIERRPRAPQHPEAEPGLHDSIDPILEKIARHGIGSLTRGEREKLERARAALLEKERRD